MQANINALKPVLYELLVAACSVDPSRELAVSQQMGVSMTPNMKKEGVNIVQIQNVKMEAIVPKIINALKMVDELCITYPPVQEAIDITPVQALAESEPWEEVCQLLYDDEVEIRKAGAMLKIHYFDFVTDRLGSKNKAAKFLQTTSGTYYSARDMLQKGGDDQDGEEDEVDSAGAREILRTAASATDIG